MRRVCGQLLLQAASGSKEAVMRRAWSTSRTRQRLENACTATVCRSV